MDRRRRGLNERIAWLLSIRSLIAFAIFAAMVVLIGYTRLGRDILAIEPSRH